jgi:hypothetical protein
MTDFLNRLERQLVTAAAAPVAPSGPLARNMRRLTPAVAVAAALLVGGAVAVCLSARRSSPLPRRGRLSALAFRSLVDRGCSRCVPPIRQAVCRGAFGLCARPAGTCACRSVAFRMDSSESSASTARSTTTDASIRSRPTFFQ